MLSKEEIKVFLWILGLSLFGLISLFQANTLYLDDYPRIVNDLGWNFNARPLATFVTLLLQMGRPFTDISPLPQLIAISLFSLGIVYLGRLFKIDNTVLLILIGLITILNPFNLSMYAFVFDSFPMTLAILCSIMGLYLLIQTDEHTKDFSKKIKIYLFSIIFLVMALSLYQTSLSFYFVGGIFYLLNKLCKDKNYKQSLINFIIFNTVLFVSMIAYIPLKNLYELSPYTIKSGELPTIDNLLEIIISNIIKSWEGAKYYIGNNSIFYLFLSLIISILLVIFIEIFFIKNNKYINQNNFDKIIILLLALSYYIIIVTSLIFPSYVLINPPWHTRIFLGVTTIICFSCFYLVNFISKYFSLKIVKYLIIFYFTLISLSLMNLSLTYGNVLIQQDIYEDRIGSLILNDIENFIIEKSIILEQPKIVFANTQDTNSIRTNKLIVNSLQKYPILNSIAQPYFTADNFGINKLKSFGFDFEKLRKEEVFRDNKDYYQPIQPPILKRQLYNIYLENNDIFVITFNE